MKNKYLQAVLATIIFLIGFFLIGKLFGAFAVEDGQTTRAALREHIIPLGMALLLSLLVSIAFFYATTRTAFQKEADATAALSLKLTSESADAADYILEAIRKYQMADKVERVAETFAQAVKTALEELAKNPSIDHATELHEYATGFAEGYRIYIGKAKIAQFDDNAKAEMKLFEDKIPSYINGMKSLIGSLGSSESLESIARSLEMKMQSWGRIN